MEFVPFRKIPRLSRTVVVTEKIDGTSGCIGVGETGILPSGEPTEKSVACVETMHGPVHIYAGSRNRWLQPGKLTDNFGFAAWVQENAKELLGLGAGRHYGEWWGLGIQRGYGLQHRKFSLFNTARWSKELTPFCCDVVPVLYEGEFSTNAVIGALHILEHTGSRAAPGFMRPEGVVVYHTAASVLFKKTVEGDESPKSAVQEQLAA